MNLINMVLGTHYGVKYDFGLLGVWSHDTLKGQLSLKDSVVVVRRIEDEYKTEKNRLYEQISTIHEQKVPKKMRQLLFDIDMERRHKDRLEKLEEDYIEYKNTVIRIFFYG